MKRQDDRPSPGRAVDSGKARGPGEKPGRPGTAGTGTTNLPHLNRKQFALMALVLAGITVMAYLPALRGQFIWDDNNYVTDNLWLRSLKGLGQIWFAPGAEPQFYPLSFSSFWVDYHLWKLNPLGYHLTNVLLQALNSILLWTILRRLRAPGAWLAAAIFTVHPVNVESVAWVTERKNVLAGFFYLSSALACLRFWLPETVTTNRAPAGADWGRWRLYWLALLLYVCALLAKTAAVGLPVAVLLVVWWKRGKLGWREVVPMAPFFAAGITMGSFTMWVERHFVQAVGRDWTFSFLERCLMAGRVVWFYLGKLAWPHPLLFVYPRWQIQAAQPLDYLPVLALVALLLILWINRRGWGRPALVALVYFLAVLFPVTGFFNVYFFRYSFVADHFQYLAAIGPLALAAAGLSRWFGTIRLFKPALCAALVVVLGVLTWRQCGTLANLDTLWRTTLAQNPDCWMAHSNLGLLLKNQGRLGEAIEQYHEALQIAPNAWDALNDLGVALAANGQYDEAIQNYRHALEIKPDLAAVQNNLGHALAAEGKFGEAIECYRQAIGINPSYADPLNNLGNALAVQGRLDEAIANYRQAIQINPDFTEALNNLGFALAAQGRFDEAITNYRRALQIVPEDAAALDNLGVALAGEGRLDEAIKNYREAIQVNPNRPGAYFHLGATLDQLNRSQEAVVQYREALRLDPNLSGALNNLAWTLATSHDGALRNGAEAVRLAERACELTHDGEPSFMGTLAAAYAEACRFPEAVSTAEKAEQLATSGGSAKLAESIRQLLDLYRAGKPYHEPAPAGR